MKKIKTDDQIDQQAQQSEFDNFDITISPEFDSMYDAFSLGYELGQLNKSCYIVDTGNSEYLCFMLGTKKSIIRRIKTYNKLD